jgi:hypothetical protein
MPQNHHQPGAEVRGRELDAAELGGRHDVPGHANDEKIAEALVEHNLHGHARIGAPKNDREGFLPFRQLGSLGIIQQDVLAAPSRHEPTVPLAKA